MARYGYRPSGNPPHYGYTGSNTSNYRGYRPNPMTENGIGYAMGLRGGPYGAGQDPRVQLQVHADDNGPGTVLERTDTIDPNTVMNDATGGANFTADLLEPVMMRSGRIYPLSFVAVGGMFAHGMASNSHPDTANALTELFYFKNETALPGDSPMGFTSSNVNGWIALWVEYESNVQPDVPINRTPGTTNPLAPTLVSTLTPDLEGDFDDDNILLPNGQTFDYLNNVEIEVRRDSDSVLMWDLDDGSVPSERTAHRFDRTYAGTPLSSGVLYRWRCRVADRFGAKSDWSNYIYFQVGAGSIAASAPTGKQETTTPGPFVGGWTHSGVLAAKAVKIRIRNSSGAIIRDSASFTLTPNVANNANISVAWASLTNASGGGAFAELAKGAAYTWEMSAQDTSNNWSGWSARKSFTVNAVPTTPVVLVPNFNDVSSSRPVIVVRSSDTDDTVATGLVVKAEIFNADTDVLLGTYNMVLKTGTTDTWELVTTSTHVPSFGNYYVTAYSYDGTWYSGGVTVEASASRAGEIPFVYATGPTVSITAPTADQVIITDTPDFTWTVSPNDQAAYRIMVDNLAFESPTDQRIYDTGTTLGQTARIHSLPSSILDNNGEYRVRIAVTDSNGLVGYSGYTNFSLVYPEPPQIAGFLASEYKWVSEPYSTGVLLSWEPTSYPSSKFMYYNITRESLEDTPVLVDDYDRPSRKIRLVRITDPEQTTYVDNFAASGVSYAYRVRQYVKEGKEVLSSFIAASIVRLEFPAVVIHQFRNPEIRAFMEARKDRRMGYADDIRQFRTWHTSKPLAFKGDFFQRLPSGSFRIYGDSREDVLATIRNLEYMKAKGEPLVYRDGDHYSLFVMIDRLDVVSPTLTTTVDVEIGMFEIDFPLIWDL